MGFPNGVVPHLGKIPTFSRFFLGGASLSRMFDVDQEGSPCDKKYTNGGILLKEPKEWDALLFFVAWAALPVDVSFFRARHH